MSKDKDNLNTRKYIIGISEKPKNHRKMKILNFQEKYSKPILIKGLEQFYNVTSCDEKCNFFILQQWITLIQILFVVTVFPHLYFRYIIQGMHYESSKSMIYQICSNILIKWTVKNLHIHKIPNQDFRIIEKDTEFIIFANSCHLKKVAINIV